MNKETINFINNIDFESNAVVYEKIVSLFEENQGLKNENTYYKYHIKLLDQQVSFLKSQLEQTNKVLDTFITLKNKYINIIDKARNKLTTMFDNGDDNKILDDLLELGEILGVK